MHDLKARFAELERVPAPDLQQLIQTQVQRLQQPGRLETGVEPAWRHVERRRLSTAWTTQVLAAAAIVAFAIGLALIFHYARTVVPATPTPIPTAAPSPLALSQPLNVDPATPVILLYDAAHFKQIDGMTWDG